MIFRRAFRFACTGILVTALHAAIAVALIRVLIAQPPLANGIAFMVATIVSYVINTHWSFSARLQGRSLARFASVASLGFLLAMAMAWGVQQLGLHYLLGIAAVAIAIPAFTFVLHHFWTYR